MYTEKLKSQFHVCFKQLYIVFKWKKIIQARIRGKLVRGFEPPPPFSSVKFLNYLKTLKKNYIEIQPGTLPLHSPLPPSPLSRRAHPSEDAYEILYLIVQFFDTFVGGLLVPGVIIRLVVSVSALTWFIRYIYY